MAIDRAGQLAGSRLVLVEIPPYAPPEERQDRFNPFYSVGKLNHSRDWFVMVPTVVRVSNDRVESVAIGKRQAQSLALTLKNPRNHPSVKLAQHWAEPVKRLAEKLPKLVCERSIYDFGALPNTAEVKHTFLIRNTGKAPLEIASLETTCGCTVAELAQKVIGPGQQVPIEVKLSLVGRGGRLRKGVLVNSNDPDHPQMLLGLQGTAHEVVDFKPLKVVFERVTDQPQTRTVDITVKDPAYAFNVQAVASDSAGFTAAWKTVKTGEAYQVVVRTKLPLTPGAAKAQIRLLTDRRDFPVIDLPVIAYVEGALPKPTVILDENPFDSKNLAVQVPLARSFPNRRTVDLSADSSYRPIRLNAAAADGGLSPVSLRTVLPYGKMGKAVRRLRGNRSLADLRIPVSALMGGGLALNNAAAGYSFAAVGNRSYNPAVRPNTPGDQESARQDAPAEAIQPSSLKEHLKNAKPQMAAEIEARDFSDFKALRYGKRLIYWRQRTIRNNKHTAHVLGDREYYQFDALTGKLLQEENKEREDLPKVLPEIKVTREEARRRASNCKWEKLMYIRSDTGIYPNIRTSDPCWVVYGEENGVHTYVVIDALTGQKLGNGLAPPSAEAFAMTGPEWVCGGGWIDHYNSAASWFNTWGYPTDQIVWPTNQEIQNYVASSTHALFYEIAHGGALYFASSCNASGYIETTPDMVEQWIAPYDKMKFAFIGSCGGMCDTRDGTFSYAFRKGETLETATVGYCGMDDDQKCEGDYFDPIDCWDYSVWWQDKMFSDINAGISVYEAFNNANAAYPECIDEGWACTRFQGDNSTSFRLVPKIKWEPGCGDAVKRSTWLSRDLNCTGDGISIEADGNLTCPIVLDCQGHAISGSHTGIGIKSSNSYGIIKNCTVRDFDTGIWLGNISGNNTIMDCQVTSNNGNGIYLLNARNDNIARTLVDQNGSHGLFIGSASGTVVQNSILASNACGAYVCANTSNSAFQNCTIASNTLSQLYLEPEADNTTALNSIIWGLGSHLSGASSVTYSDVQGGWTGAGNIKADPVFVGPAVQNFHLIVSSPCINAGDPSRSYADQTDIDSQVRLSGGRVDMGADEVPAAEMPVISPPGGNFPSPQTVTITCATPKAVIRHRLDGRDPATTDIGSYSVPFTLRQTATVKARAWADNLAPSAVASADFTIGVNTSLSGTVVLSDYPPGTLDQTLTIKLAKDGILTSYNWTLPPNGAWTIDNLTVGRYDVWVKASHWLAKAVRNVTINQPVDIGLLMLTNGDCDSDNQISPADQGMILAAMDGTPADSFWNPNADLDGDNEITSGDLSIGLVNADQKGADPYSASPWVFVSGDTFPYQNDTSNYVFVNNFCIDKYETTNAMYCHFLNATAATSSSNWDAAQEIVRTGTAGSYQYSVIPGRENYPVCYVSHNDALAYAAWRGQEYRLPTEQEWEKAAAWDLSNNYYYEYGFHQDNIDVTWCNYNGAYGTTSPVGSFNGTGGKNDGRSYYGCYDMSGNVGEWVGNEGYVRGGGWGDVAQDCTCVARHSALPLDYRGSGIGFRLAFTPQW